MDDVTAVMVTYNTERLAKRAYGSLRKFYPDMKAIIIDNSDRHDACAAYVRSLESDTTRVIKTKHNVGHGPGMHAGIRQAETKYALVFDSDVVILKDCVPLMLEKVDEDSFGVGKVVYVDINGDNGRPAPAPTNRRAMKYYRYYAYKSRSPKTFTIPYLHPHFHLVDTKNYRKFRPYFHHGAPCLATMMDIHQRRMSKRLLVDFPVEQFVRHDGRGTRRTYPLDYRKDRWQRV